MTAPSAIGPAPRWAWRSVAATIVATSIVANVLAGVPDAGAFALRVMYVVLIATYLSVGTLIIERRPGNRVGIVVFLFGALVGAYLIADALIAGGGNDASTRLVAWAVSLSDAPLFILVSLLFLLFPDGHLPSRRWRTLLVVQVVLSGIATTWAATHPGPLAFYPQFENPFGRATPVLEVVGPIAYGLVVLCVGLSALSLAGRWRRGGPVERAQLKWVASAALVVAMSMAAYALVIGPGRFDRVFDLLMLVAFAGIPIAIGVAILRYHLFEIDRLVSRTVAYVVVTAVLVGAYAAGILVLQGPLGSVTGGDAVAVAASTLAAAALFQPVRSRVQSVVDRRFDRARYDAELTSVAFAGRLRNEVDLPAVAADLRATVRAAVAPSGVGLWLREGRP